MTEDNPCMECGGKCCSYKSGLDIVWESLEPGERYDTHFLEHDHLDQLIRQSGEIVDMDWYIKTEPNGHRALVFECNHQTEDGKCGIYDDRPWLCSEFECSYLSGDVTYEQFMERHGLPEEEMKKFDYEEVTDRVNEIIKQKVL